MIDITHLSLHETAAALGHGHATALIRCEPCCSCDDAARETETGAFFCRASRYGDPECATFVDVRQLEDVAIEMAARIRTLDDQDMRRELAQGVADGLANAMYVRDKNVEVDTCEFVRRAGGMPEGTS